MPSLHEPRDIKCKRGPSQIPPTPSGTRLSPAPFTGDPNTVPFYRSSTPEPTLLTQLDNREISEAVINQMIEDFEKDFEETS